MISELLAGLALLGLSGWVLHQCLAPARAIWRGDASRVPLLPPVTPSPRGYLAFLLWAVPAYAGIGLLGVAAIVDAVLYPKPVAIAITGIVLMCSAVPLIVVNIVVHVSGRPKLLVPPPYRDQPGAIAAARDRRTRRRAGLPPTEHRVELIDVRPLPPHDDGFEPYMRAICTEPGCDWHAESDDSQPGIPEESQLREKAATHTTRVDPTVRRPIG